LYGLSEAVFSQKAFLLLNQYCYALHPITTETGRANSLNGSADVTVSGMLLQMIKFLERRFTMKKLMNVVLLAALVFTLNADFFGGLPQIDDYGVTPMHDLDPNTDLHT
jgi:hypothetical protein